MKFAYQAVDAGGKVVNDTIEATDQSEAMDALRRQGLYVSELTASSNALSYARPRGKRRRLSTGRRLKNMAIFTRQLSVLVASGTPLVQALGALERQTRDAAWRDIVAAVRVRV